MVLRVQGLLVKHKGLFKFVNNHRLLQMREAERE
jgi:hypothetical protein